VNAAPFTKEQMQIWYVQFPEEIQFSFYGTEIEKGFGWFSMP
jgi:hypothetical protein